MSKTNTYPAIICGHGLSSDGSWDPGCVYKVGKKTYTEADLMLPITRAFVKYLKASGLKVYSDESGDNMKNMNRTISEANAKKCDYYISLHCDYSGAPTGTYPYYYTGSKEGRKLADCLNKAVMKDMKIKTRGLHGSTSLGEVSSTNMPSCIFETGSIKADLKILRDQPDNYGKALAKGFCNFLGIKFQEPNFKVRAKKNLIVRSTPSLTSKKLDKVCKKGMTYTIIETNEKGTRGRLKTGGWITITSKYVERI